MQNNILFDNIYIGHSVEDARKLADETFFEKHPLEQLAELADKPKEEEKPEAPKSPSDLKFLDDPTLYIKEKLDLFLTIAAKDPIEAIRFVPEVAGGIGAILVTLIAVVVGLVSLGGAAPAPAAKKVATDAKDKAKDKAAEASSTGADTGKSEASKRSTRSQS
jgi:calnexin